MAFLSPVKDEMNLDHLEIVPEIIHFLRRMSEELFSISRALP